MTTSECIITALSSIVDMKLVFMCQVVRNKQTYFLCLSKHMFFFISLDFQTVKDKVNYAFIEKLVIDSTNRQLLEIELSDDRPPGSPKKLVFTTPLVKSLVENFTCYWQTDFMFRMGSFKEFPLVLSGELVVPMLFGGGEENSEAMTEKLKEAEFQRRLAPRLLRPDKSSKWNMKGYVYYLPKTYKLKQQKVPGLFISSEDQVLGSSGLKTLQVQITGQLPIELLASKKTERGLISEIAENHAENIINKEESKVKEQFWLMYSRPYMKKQNLMSDKSSWEGWEVHLRTANLDVFVILLRRKFIPPSMDHYTDFTFSLQAPFDPQIFNNQIQEAIDERDLIQDIDEEEDQVEDDFFEEAEENKSQTAAPKDTLKKQKTQFLPPRTKKTLNLFKTQRLLAPKETSDMPTPYDDENEQLLVDSSKDAYDIFVDCVDSLHPLSKASEVLNQIIEQRCNALLMTEETAYFYKSQLKKLPIEPEMMSIKILRRILYLLVKNNQEDRLKIMIRQLNKKLKNGGVEQGASNLALQTQTCIEIFKEFMIVQGEPPKEKLETGDINWKEKVTRYLAYCVDGGLLFQDFNLTQMLDLMTNLDPRDHDEIKQVLALMMYFRKVGHDYNDKDSLVNSINRMMQTTSVPADDQDGQEQEAPAEIEDGEEVQGSDSFTFNDRVMEKLILHNWLITHINEAYTYTKFFNLILRTDTDWSSDRIRAAVLQKIIEIYEQLSMMKGDDAGGKNKQDELQLGIVSPTIQVFWKSSSKRLCILGAKGLFHMSHMDTYRMFMMRQGVVTAIMDRLRASDPTVVEQTMLLLNAITSNKDSCGMTFQQVQLKQLIAQLLIMVKGVVSGIPGAFYSAKTGTYALATLYNIVKNQHKNAIQNSDQAIKIIIQRLIPAPFQLKQTQRNIIEGEKLIYLILEYICRGSTTIFKERLIAMSFPVIQIRVTEAMEKGEEIWKYESTTAMLAYFKTQTKDCPPAVALIGDLDEFLDKARLSRLHGKLPLILMQRVF